MAGNESFGLVWRDIQEGARMREVTTPVREPLPRPARGPFRIGLDAFWYDYSGQLGHGGVGQLAEEMMAAYLVLYWSGTLGAPKQRKRGIFTTILGAVGAVLSGLAIGKYVKDRKEEE